VTSVLARKDRHLPCKQPAQFGLYLAMTGASVDSKLRAAAISLSS
jgi:hypothetical protein